MDSEQQLERRNRLNGLMDIYGELLTDRQRMFLELHIAEDLSFGEIAEQHKVSRQAVHDSVKHAEMSLENFEEKLRLLKIRESSEENEGESVAYYPTPKADASADNSQVAEKLKGIVEELRRSGGVIYNADEVANRLDAIMSQIDRK